MFPLKYNKLRLRFSPLFSSITSCYLYYHIPAISPHSARTCFLCKPTKSALSKYIEKCEWKGLPGCLFIFILVKLNVCTKKLEKKKKIIEAVISIKNSNNRYYQANFTYRKFNIKTTKPKLLVKLWNIIWLLFHKP